MAGVQDVEATVGKDNPFALLSGVINVQQALLDAGVVAAGLGRPLVAGAGSQFLRGNGCGA